MPADQFDGVMADLRAKALKLEAMESVLRVIELDSPKVDVHTELSGQRARIAGGSKTSFQTSSAKTSHRWSSPWPSKIDQ